MKNILRYLLDRLGEASTLRGIVLLAFGLGGYQLSDADAMQLVAAGQIIAGAIGAALLDRTPRGS